MKIILLALVGIMMSGNHALSSDDSGLELKKILDQERTIRLTFLREVILEKGAFEFHSCIGENRWGVETLIRVVVARDDKETRRISPGRSFTIVSRYFDYTRVFNVEDLEGTVEYVSMIPSSIRTFSQLVKACKDDFKIEIITAKKLREAYYKEAEPMTTNAL